MCLGADLGSGQAFWLGTPYSRVYNRSTAERPCGGSGFLCSDPGWLSTAISLFPMKAVLASQCWYLPRALFPAKGTFPAHDLGLRLSEAGHVLHPPSFAWPIRQDSDSRTVNPQTDRWLMRWPGMKSSSLSEAGVVNKANGVSFLEI